VKYCRFETEDGPQLGEVQDRDGEFWVVRNLSTMLTLEEGESAAYFEPKRMSELTLLPPVTPTKIVCVGRNYRDHAKELGNDVPAEPLLFFKPPSSLLAPGGVIRLPQVSQRVDFEGELAVVIAKRARKLRHDEDLSPYIHGYTLANDVTARDLQKKDGQWTRAKGFDTFCPVGPIVDTGLNLDAGLTIETRVNGELRQHGSTADFIFTLPVLLEYITAAITLEPGDLLLTGTPAGVGPLVAGDVVEVSIVGLGRLANPVEVEED
jgi:2-keto-4-pentenoate hydratase/2-oxohepta-3-ene-1,7-dioic acid hydratase in catechol pathway